MFLEELEALIIFNSLPFRFRKNSLIDAHFGSATAALKAPLEEIATYPGFGPKILKIGEWTW